MAVSMISGTEQAVTTATRQPASRVRINRTRMMASCRLPTTSLIFLSTKRGGSDTVATRISGGRKVSLAVCISHSTESPSQEMFWPGFMVKERAMAGTDFSGSPKRTNDGGGSW